LVVGKSAFVFKGALIFLYLWLMLEFIDVSFSYNQSPLLSHLSFVVPQGSHTCVIGESGCGKSTLLKLAYGIYDPGMGEILYCGKSLPGPSRSLIPGLDPIKYLSQDFGLMPFITVSENVGKFLSNTNSFAKNQRIEQLLDLVDLQQFAATRAKELSGGQQQRAALAMVLAKEPKLLLLDEPFSQIDAFRTNDLRRKIYGYCRAQGISCLTATHDAADVLSFSDQVLVMKEGQIVNRGEPQNVYEKPDSFYTASLFSEVSSLVFDNSAQLFYPHQLCLKQTGVEANVVASYYKGNLYLIEATSSQGTVFFNHECGLDKGAKIFVGPK
jgi:ABC-type Fe3+/spermidine/putrescine transport system ATPase subunit